MSIDCSDFARENYMALKHFHDASPCLLLRAEIWFSRHEPFMYLVKQTIK